MFNYAVYADQESRANARQAEQIKLNRAGEAVNTGHNGRSFTISEVIAAQESQSYRVYSDAMSFLDSIMGDDNDTATRNAYTQAKSKFQSIEHASQMRDKLMFAALNGSNVALIAYAAACVFINPYAAVNFSWFVNGSDELTVVYDVEGYEAAQVSISSSAPMIDDESDYEGFAVTIRPMITTQQPTPAPVKILPMVVTLTHEKGTLTQTSDGWTSESKTSPGTFHHTSHDGSKCTCKGHVYRSKCWHTAAVRAHHLAHA